MRSRFVAMMAVLILLVPRAWGEEGKEKEVKTEKVKIGPFNYPIPTSWQRQRATKPFRVIQYGIPKAEGDEQKTEFYVSANQGQMGDVKTNINRWVGMFEQKDGKEKVEEFSVGDVKVVLVDISGSYKDKPFPMADEYELRKNYRMLAAIVETPDDGSFYFRMTGPKKSVGEQAAHWKKMFKSISKDG